MAFQRIFQRRTRKVTFKRRAKAGTRKCPRCGGDGRVRIRRK